MPVYLILFVIFIGFSAIEISFLIEIGSVIGALPTVGLVFLTAIVGSSLVRSQGLQALHTIQEKMKRGEAPDFEIVQGMLILIAGGLLIVPGFITDFWGILLITPWIRRRFATHVLKGIAVRVETQNASQGGQTIEGEYETKDKRRKR